MGSQLDLFLSSYSRETREIVLCLRGVILGVSPDLAEQIDSKSGVIAYVFGGMSETDRILTIVPHMKHVNLLFCRGAELPDPSNLLVGTGKEARHVRIKSEEQTQNLAFLMLLTEALKMGREESV